MAKQFLKVLSRIKILKRRACKVIFCSVSDKEPRQKHVKSKFILRNYINIIRITTIIKYLEILDLLHIYQIHSDWDTSGYELMKHSSFKAKLFV